MFTPESLAVSASIYSGIGFLSAIRYLYRKRNTKLTALIVGPACGKSTLCANFNKEYPESEFYLLDIEGLLEVSNGKYPQILKDELQKIKASDAILYLSRVMKIYMVLLSDVLPTLRSMKKKIVIVLSNRIIAKHLKIKQRVYLTSSKSLFAKQMIENNEYEQYMMMCRKSMKVSKTLIFKSYDDLFERVKEILGVYDKL